MCFNGLERISGVFQGLIKYFDFTEDISEVFHCEGEVFHDVNTLKNLLCESAN